MFSRWKFQIRLIAIAAVLAALTGAFLGERVAYAQGGDSDYVDVGITLEVPEVPGNNAVEHDLKIIVVNHGSRTAYDVEVVVNVVYPEDNSRFKKTPRVPAGDASLENNERTLEWLIPSLGGLQREEVIAEVQHRTSVAPAFDYRNYPHEHFGKVTTSSFESKLHKGNNTARVWSYRKATAVDHFDQVGGNYSVTVSVDNASPSPGDTVNFTIATVRAKPPFQTHLTPPPIDLKVDIELTGGLTVSGSPSFVSKNPDSNTPDAVVTTPASVSYSDGVFNVRTLKAGDAVKNSVTLPITVASSAAGSEQCLTATLTGNPPPGVGPYDDDISDNVAKVCIGAAPAGEQVVLDSGGVSAFALYPCVGIEDHPCDGSDDVRVRAIANVGVVDSGKAIFHVQDHPLARAFDSHAGSVNDGTTVSWQTSCHGGSASCTGFNPDRDEYGVKLGWNRIPFNGHWRRDGPPATGEWKGIGLKVTARGKGAGTDPPGKLNLRSTGSRNSLYTLTKAKGWSHTWRGDNPWKPSSDTNNISYQYFDFEKLGTYYVDYTLIATHYSKAGNCDTAADADNDPDAFCGTETYVFHVGPIQDLEVLAGDSAAAGQTAYIIRAVNNGPENAVDAAVKVALPSGVLVEDYVASDGTYANGVWTLPGLKLRDYRRSEGIPEETTLTLILKDDGGVPKEPAEATISLTDNSYNVCIASNRSTLAHDNETDCVAVTGASWHEGTIYDPSGNNTAKITAVKGTGGIAPGAPGASASSNARSVTLSWNTVQLVNTIPVGHYEVQKYIGDEGRGSWQTVSGPVPDTKWTDFNVGSGPTGPYRVRAVNGAGIGGPWSAQVNRLTAAQQGQLSAPALTAKTTTHDTVRLTWTEPTNQQDAITGYELEHLAGDTWTALESLLATERVYEHLNLSPGEQWSYRVRAMSSAGPGRWSNVAATETPPGQPFLRAEANGPTSILLTWDPGSYSVSRYELEVSTQEGGSYSRLANPSGTARSYSHNTGAINPEVRWYRIRACNSAGCGGWTGSEYATTALQGTPSAPNLTVRSSSASEIKLSWNKPHDGGSEITEYELEHFTDGQNWANLYPYPATATEYAHQEEFGGGTTHRYRVRAVNEDENGQERAGAWSTVRSVTIPAGLPGAPTLSFESADDNSITLAWTVPETNGARITGYRVERSELLGGIEDWTRVGSTSGSVTTYTDRNLYSYSQYCYRVAATSNVGTGAWSELDCGFTTGEWVPTDPPILRLSSVSATSVSIAWDPPLRSGGRPITGYVYELSDAEGQFHDDCDYATHDRELWPTDPERCFQVSAGQRTKSFSGLDPGKSYSFRVRTVTAYEESDWAEISARLPAASDNPETTGVTEDLQVRLSTTGVTVNEGSGVARYTVRLNKAPKAPRFDENGVETFAGETVELNWYLDGRSGIFVDWEADEPNCYSFEFNRDNWSSGCTFTLSAEEDRDSDNEIVIMEHSIEVGDREVTGPGVRVEERDND